MSRRGDRTSRRSHIAGRVSRRVSFPLFDRIPVVKHPVVQNPPVYMTDTPRSNGLSANASVPEPLSDPTTDRDLESYALTTAAVQAAEDRKGADIVVLRVEEVSYLADYFVIVTGFSRVQVRAISEAVRSEVEERLQRQPVRIEGQSEGSWILQDYGDVLVHVLMPDERDFYNLEAFWGHAERVELSEMTGDRPDASVPSPTSTLRSPERPSERPFPEFPDCFSGLSQPRL